ncbi:type IV pili methyl-accepting chemotaxis transducer N-terminal domain-containing protein [Roseobacter sp. MH60115]|uniref:type IV pili methyl-accepting chemotaxis transducer N-terminal domain-containing protein n=1 Tax=Roseobacter sp. MH60115 TaxID=2785324 RepID=UPI0018A2CA16|nr:type IV pili methyl-accepting chemotaxis transducer N-terminal domain-containing protein [Roseobacter sp. MH60115]
MYSLTRRILASCLILSTIVFGDAGTISRVEAAEITAETNARNRMNYAGRQRMLTQQIARNACFVMAGVDPERFAGKTETNVRQFSSVILGLRNGDPKLGILPETNQDVLAALSDVDELWNSLGPAARQISAGDFHSIPMRQLINLNTETLTRMHATVKIMEGLYQDERVSADLLATISLAGRQRMLTQKVSKEVCFKTIGLRNVGAAEKVDATIADFDAAMAKLLAGSEEGGILAPPNRQIKRQLIRADKAWGDFKELVQHVRDEPNVDHGTGVKLANMSDQVLREMDLAVTMYTQ